jgi:TrmH family RNA methyltransferase
MSMLLTSLQNPRIKNFVKLDKPAERAQRQVTVVEGEREAARALAAGIVPVEAFLCRQLLAPDSASLVDQLEALDRRRQTLLYEVTQDIFAKLAYRGASGGILLVVPYFAQSLETLHVPDPAFLAVIEGVEKPGNLGAILRTADAAGLHGVIVSAGATDIYNPNVIRASLGAIFTVPVVEAAPAATIAWLQRRQIQIIAATPDADTIYTSGESAMDATRPIAMVMGSEAHGLSPIWREAATDLVRIPMLGTVDSLNLATSTALLLYEVVRRRAL